MALKTSLLITGDASAAKKAVDEAAASVRDLDQAGKAAAAGGLSAAARAETEAASAAKAMAAAEAQLGDEMRRMQAAASSMTAQLGTQRETIAALTGRIDVLESRLKASGKATRDATGDAARHATATRNLGQQFGDLAVMIQGGISPARAFATQAGQMGYAMSDMGGKAGAVGRFLVGPLGIALTVATAALAPMVEELFKGGTASAEFYDKASAAAGAADSFGAAQTAMGKLIESATGKLQTQNMVLTESIRLQAKAGIQKAQDERREARRDLLAAGDPGILSRAGTAASGTGFGMLTGAIDGYRNGDGLLLGSAKGAFRGGIAGAGQNVDPRLNGIATQYSNGAISIKAAREQIEKLGLSATRTNTEVAKLVRFGIAGEDLAANQAMVSSIDSGRLDPRLKPDRRGRSTKPKSGEALAAFGENAGEKIAGIVGEFDQVPSAIDKANAKIRELDRLIADLGKKKPEGFAELIASAEAAKTTVRDGLIRAIGEGFEKPKTLADKAAVAFGQLDAVLADVEKRKLPAAEVERLAGKVRESRAAVEGALNKPLDDFLQQQAEQLAQGELILSGRLAEAEALRAIIAIERQRGPLSAEQKAQVVATTIALQAQERQLERVRARQQVSLDALSNMRDLVRTTIYEGPQAVLKLPERLFESFKAYSADKIAEELFGDVFRDMRDQVTGASKVDAASGALVSAFATTATAAATLSGALNQAAGAAGAAAAPALPGGVTGAPKGEAGEGDIVVSARRHSDVYGETIAKVLTKIGIGKDTAATLGKTAGKALAGAFEGQAAAGVAGMFGIKTSSTGAAIGGAIGSALPIPGGSIIGGLLGGVLGGAFTKPKYGTSAVTSVDNASVAGNSAAAKGAAGSLGEAVQQGVARIAEQLGGTLGDFAVSIGTYKDKVRVSTTGYDGRLGNQGKRTASLGIVDFGKGGEAAGVAFAIRDAIADGAVQGLSARVQKALSSNTDIDKALKEALKVQDMEMLVGGQLAVFQKAFRDFEAQAKDRVRIAEQYGFDVLAIEKRNADDRVKLAAELARAQTGALQGYLDEIATGGLFEGSALDRVAALTSAIGKAEADLAANVEGAGDRLAGLLANRDAAAKEAYGATGEFAAIRASSISAAQAAIARTNAEIARANEAKSDPALRETNQALDENNGQNAEIIALLRRQGEAIAMLAAGAGGGGSAAGYAFSQAAAY